MQKIAPHVIKKDVSGQDNTVLTEFTNNTHYIYIRVNGRGCDYK